MSRRSFFLPARGRRATEASPQQLVATGALGGGWETGDGDGRGWRVIGGGGRPVPPWTHERARQQSVAAYRMNPMAKAIVDTYTSFCVGDTGVSPMVSNPRVAEIVRQFWVDPRNLVAKINPLLFRSCLINGETLLEMMPGPITGVVRFKPLDPSIVRDVVNLDGNPLWPDRLLFTDDYVSGGTRDGLRVVQVDDSTGLLTGEALWHTPFKTLDTDTRSQPFLSTVLDPLDSYDVVINNLVDRTALSRYMVWDVTVTGGKKEVDAFLAERGGNQVPKSGSVEVHNEGVKWEPKYAQTGAYEDTTANKNVLTTIAAGAGLSKTWLAEPEDANRATSMTMAEPVRRRLGGVQKDWLDFVGGLSRYAIDRAVASGRLDAEVESVDGKTGAKVMVPASQTLTITGPEIAAADAQIHASVLLNLATGLEKMVDAGILTTEAAAVAGRKAWEDFMGIPWQAELAKTNANPDDVADHVEKAKRGNTKPSLLDKTAA